MSVGNRKREKHRHRDQRKKAFKRRWNAAVAGIHLPTYEELLCGCPFMAGELRQDAQAFAERLLPKISPDVPAGRITRKRIQALTLQPLAVDFRAASHALQQFAAENSKNQRDLMECAMRCELYAGAAGSTESAFATAKWAMQLGHDILLPADRMYELVLSAVGWLILANGYLPYQAINNDVPGLAMRLARHLFERLVTEHSQGEAEEKPKEKEDNPDAPLDAAALDLAFGADNSNDPLSVVVLKALGNADVSGGKSVAREFDKVTGKRLPLTPLPDLAKVRHSLICEFPHAANVTENICDSLATQPHVKMKPMILLGSPGSGKTTFASRVLQLLGVPSERYPCGGIADSSLAGCARRWSTGEPSLPLSLVRRHLCASPGIVLDEVEKVASSNHNGNLLDALLGLLERESSEAWFDPYVQAAADLSHVLWICTANSVETLPLPLRDRCRIILFPDPEAHHLSTLAPRILRRLVLERGLDERWALPLDGVELDLLARNWPGGSLRKLERLVEALFKARGDGAILQ